MNAKACEGLVVRTQSSRPLHTAIAAPCFPPGGGDESQMFVIVLFSAQNRHVSFQMIEFLCSLTALINGGPPTGEQQQVQKEGDTMQLKESTSNTDFQKFYVENTKVSSRSSSSTDMPVKNMACIQNFPVVFLGEPDSLIEIRRNSDLNPLDGVLAHQERAERYQHFMSGVLQLTSFDIAEVWLPDPIKEDSSSSPSSSTDLADPVKLASSCHLEPAMQPWCDFSKLLTLPPGLDFPGRIVAESTALVDAKYNTHQPFDANYPRAMNAHFLGLQVRDLCEVT